MRVTCHVVSCLECRALMAGTVEELIAETSRAVAQNDATAAAALYHQNANLPDGGDGSGVGRRAIEEHFRIVLPLIPVDISHEVESRRIHYVTPDLAVIDTVGTNYRVPVSGEREPVSREAFTMVAVRESGHWLWAAVRGALVPRSRGDTG